MSDITEQVGQLIREARKAKGLTQKDLGLRLGVSSQAVTKYESGQNLTIETLHKISQVLESTIASMLKGL